MKIFSSVISLSFLVILLLVSCEKSSSDWVKYKTDIKGNVYSYKIVNIEKKDGNHLVQVWEKTVVSNKDEEIGTFMFLNEIDCKNRKVRTLSFILYDKEGKTIQSPKPIPLQFAIPVQSYNYGSKWDYIVPDSSDETILKKVCE